MSKQTEIPIDPVEPSAAEKAHTEETMLRLIEAKYAENPGNGPAWAVVPQVRDAAGFDAKRTADAIVMALWPSRGLALHGFEIKVSRSDWLRELKRPEKAEVFCALVDFWWVAVSDKNIVRPGELPDGWGLMVADKRGLVVKTQAQALRPGLNAADKPITRSFLAALLRSAARVQKAGPIEIQEAVADARRRSEDLHGARHAHDEETIRDLRQRIQNFEREAGFSIDDRFGYGHKMDATEMGRIVRAVVNGEHDMAAMENRLRSMRRTATDLIEQIDRSLPDQPLPDGILPMTQEEYDRTKDQFLRKQTA